MTCTRLSFLLTTASLLPAALAQSTMTPVAGFGTAGWLAPFSSTFLTTGNTERGLAYNPITGNLVLVSRANASVNVRLLDGATGADLGAFDNTNMTGGTFAANMAGITDDGVIYVANLSTSAASNFKVYTWPSELLGPLVPPTLAFDAPSGADRTGDAFAVMGDAVTPHMFAAGGSTAAASGQNSNFVHGTLNSSNARQPYLAIPGTSTNANDYRLGITFVDADTVIGNQGTNARVTDFNGTTATVTESIALGGAARRALDYAVIGGVPVLAVIDSNSSTVTVFDLSVPGSPLALVSGNATTGTLIANGNGTGSVQWGAISGNTATLYAMNTNQGIQAFTVTIQSPARASTFGIGCGAPTLTLNASAAPVLGTTFDLQTTNIPASAVLGGYVLGFVGIPGGVPLPIAPGCSQYVLPVASTTYLTLGSSSNLLPQSYPGGPAYAGLVLFAQAVTVDGTSAILTSNGLRLYLENF